MSALVLPGWAWSPTGGDGTCADGSVEGAGGLAAGGAAGAVAAGAPADGACAGEDVASGAGDGCPGIGSEGKTLP